jgi:hypothetical protein
VYSAPELAPQNISTGRPSQPQRPPGSKQCGVLLGTTHSPNLSPLNPHRSPVGHSASPLQAKEGRFLAAVVATESGCGCVLLQATRQIVTSKKMLHKTAQMIVAMRLFIDNFATPEAPTSTDVELWDPAFKQPWQQNPASLLVASKSP